MGRRRCPRCGEEKPIGEFERRRSTKSGRGGYCKPCRAAKGREWRKANPEKAKASAKRQRRRRRCKARGCGRTAITRRQLCKQHVEQIARAAADGRSVRAVARELSVHYSTAHRAARAAQVAQRPPLPPRSGRDYWQGTECRITDCGLPPVERHLCEEHLRQIHRLRSEGLSLRGIAKELALSAPTVRRVLQKAP